MFPDFLHSFSIFSCDFKDSPVICFERPDENGGEIWLNDAGSDWLDRGDDILYV